MTLGGETHLVKVLKQRKLHWAVNSLSASFSRLQTDRTIYSCEAGSVSVFSNPDNDLNHCSRQTRGVFFSLAGQLFKLLGLSPSASAPRCGQSHVFMMWMLHALLYTFLYNLRSVCCHGCPEKCVCEAAASVQCFRVQSIPSGIPGDVRKLNLGYNHIKEMKVMLNIWHLVTDLFYFGFSIKCLPDSEACSWSHNGV